MREHGNDKENIFAYIYLYIARSLMENFVSSYKRYIKCEYIRSNLNFNVNLES